MNKSFREEVSYRDTVNVTNIAMKKGPISSWIKLGDAMLSTDDELHSNKLKGLYNTGRAGYFGRYSL